MDGSLHYLSFESRLGWIFAASSAKGLCLLDFTGPAKPQELDLQATIHRHCPGTVLEPGETHPLLYDLRQKVLQYLKDGSPVPLYPVDFRKGTAFQQEVWSALCRIPHGETRTYQELARMVARPHSARAVGQACGKNPIAIVVPCHRVIASNGGMGGYSGGLHIKKALLALERGFAAGSERVNSEQ